MKVVEVKGIGAILKNMDKHKKSVGSAFATGLKTAGLFLQGESQAIVPFQLGELHGSAFTRNVGGKGFDADVVVGYTAKYAPFVHENLDAAHGKEFNIIYAEAIAAAVGTKKGTAKGGMFNRGENQQAKFLETPARNKRKEIIQIVADKVRSVK